MIAPVVDLAIMAIRVDSLNLATEHAGSDKLKHRSSASSTCSLKIKSASDSAPGNSMIEPVVNPTIVAIRVDSLSLATEHARFDKPKHEPPVSSQRSLEIAKGLLQ